MGNCQFHSVKCSCRPRRRSRERGRERKNCSCPYPSPMFFPCLGLGPKFVAWWVLPRASGLAEGPGCCSERPRHAGGGTGESRARVCPLCMSGAHQRRKRLKGMGHRIICSCAQCLRAQTVFLVLFLELAELVCHRLRFREKPNPVDPWNFATIIANNQLFLCCLPGVVPFTCRHIVD